MPWLRAVANPVAASVRVDRHPSGTGFGGTVSITASAAGEVVSPTVDRARANADWFVAVASELLPDEGGIRTELDELELLGGGRRAGSKGVDASAQGVRQGYAPSELIGQHPVGRGL